MATRMRRTAAAPLFGAAAVPRLLSAAWGSGRCVAAGSKIVLADEPARADGSRPSVKGAGLSGRDGILFRRNSLTGAIEAVRRRGVGVTLNEALHA